MAEIVTLELPETLAQRAKEIAALTNQRLEDVLVEWIDRASTELPVESLPDDWVLALCELIIIITITIIKITNTKIAMPTI
jgi:hypothetical protein